MGWLKKKFPHGLKTRKKRLGLQPPNQQETDILISSFSHQQCNAQRKLVDFSVASSSSGGVRFCSRRRQLHLGSVLSKPLLVPRRRTPLPPPTNRINKNFESDLERRAERSRQLLMSGGSMLMERTYSVEELQFRELEEQVWLLMWLVLEPHRLQYLVQKYGNDRMSRRWAEGRYGSWLVWRALLVSCSAEGTKSASPVPLAENHICDMPCLRDHVSRMLEICAPTRDHWRMFGWTGLSVEAVLQKVIKEDIMTMIQTVDTVPPELEASLTRLSGYQRALERERQATLCRVEGDRTKGNPNGGIMPKKRGRPAKATTLKNKETGRMDRVFLWKFLLELLEDRDTDNCLRWVSREEGIFRIINTDLLARMWGRRHGNPGMTYEKLARAMRTYYRSGTFLMVPRCRNLPRKLVYRFSPNTMQKFWQRPHHQRGPNTPPVSPSTPETLRNFENAGILSY